MRKHPDTLKFENHYCPVNYFEGTGLRKMALRKLAYEALKEKHHIPKSEHAIRSKVALMPGFIQLMELVFLSRGRQFLSKIPMSVAISGAFFCSLDFLLHFFIKKKVEEEISSL